MAIKASYAWQGSKSLPHHKVSYTMTRQAILDELKRMFGDGAICYRYKKGELGSELGCIDIDKIDKKQEVRHKIERGKEVLELVDDDYITIIERRLDNE